MGQIRVADIIEYRDENKLSFIIESELVKLKELTFAQQDLGIIKIKDAYKKIAELNNYSIDIDDWWATESGLIELGDLATRRALLAETPASVNVGIGWVGWVDLNATSYFTGAGVIDIRLDRNGNFFVKCIVGFYGALYDNEPVYCEATGAFAEWYRVDFNSHKLRYTEDTVGDISNILDGEGIVTESTSWGDYSITEYYNALETGDNANNSLYWMNKKMSVNTPITHPEMHSSNGNGYVNVNLTYFDYINYAMLESSKRFTYCRINRNFEDEPDNVKFIDVLKKLNQLYNAYLRVNNGIIEIKTFSSEIVDIMAKDILLGTYEKKRYEPEEHIDNKYCAYNCFLFNPYFKNKHKYIISFESTVNLPPSVSINIRGNRGIINKREYKIIGGGYKYECYCE